MKPILFNTDMVKAILDGRKTVTRRLIKPRFRDGEAGFQIVTNEHTGEFIRVEIYDEYENETRWLDPPYSPGDILYVRETWNIHSGSRFNSLCKIEFAAGGPLSKIQFAGAGSQGDSRPEYDCFMQKWQRTGWIPSLHMPKAAARIFLRVTKVSAQPLQWCGNAQAKDEGCSCCAQFVRVWDSTIKPADLPTCGWEANPWVWVIEFERCEKPEEEDHG